MPGRLRQWLKSTANALNTKDMLVKARLKSSFIDPVRLLAQIHAQRRQSAAWGDSNEIQVIALSYLHVAFQLCSGGRVTDGDGIQFVPCDIADGSVA